MKKLILFLLSTISIGVSVSGQSIYQQSFKDINGQSISLNSYTGKKLLFFIVPLNPRDSNYARLQVFKKRYRDSVQIVGILSIEDGYREEDAFSLKTIYARMGIVLTEGMYTRKSSGSRQSPLINWLTDVKKNTHFDMDAQGVGHMFFINTTGKLFAVMPPRVSLESPVIDRIVRSAGQ